MGDGSGNNGCGGKGARGCSAALAGPGPALPTAPAASFHDDLLLKNLEAAALLDDAVIQKRLLRQLTLQYVGLERRVSELLRNTLPPSVAEEIESRGKFPARPYECTILFADIVGFTRMAERLSAASLLDLLDALFRGFDELTARHNGTKIKTIGDAYMVAFGAPEPCPAHAEQAIRLALAMIDHLAFLGANLQEEVHMRIGVHTGQVMGGVVGKERMQFDIFGDSVNVASRFESAGAMGRVHVSQATYERTRHLFVFEERGEIPLKNKGVMKGYFVVAGARGHGQQ